MSRYVECLECGFVLEAASGAEPAPGRWESCPDCGRIDFEFVDG